MFLLHNVINEKISFLSSYNNHLVATFSELDFFILLI